MTKQTLLLKLLRWVALSLLLAGASLFGQDEEAAGRAAEQAGKSRLAFTHYVAALQSAPEGSDADQRLREQIIALALSLTPPPAVPLEAKKHMARGQGLLEAAQKPEDFQSVLAEFHQASLAAPWWADAYYNLAQVEEKVGNYGETLKNLRWYLKASPHATDTETVELQIAKLEAKQEAAAKVQAEAARARQAEEDRVRQERERYANLDSLQGIWTREIWFEGLGWRRVGEARIVRNGNTLEIHNRTVVQGSTEESEWFRGEITGSDLSSVQLKQHLVPLPAMCSTATFTAGWYPVLEVAEKNPGKEIWIKYRMVHSPTAESRDCDLNYVQSDRLTR